MTAQTGTKPDGVGPREVLDRMGSFLGRHQSMRIIIGALLLAAALPLAGGVLGKVVPSFGTQNDWVGNFADAGVFILLACGLKPGESIELEPEQAPPTEPTIP